MQMEDKLLTLSKIFDIFDTGMTGKLRIAELGQLLLLVQDLFPEDELKRLEQIILEKNPRFFTLQQIIDQLEPRVKKNPSSGNFDLRDIPEPYDFSQRIESPVKQALKGRRITIDLQTSLDEEEQLEDEEINRTSGQFSIDKWLD